MRRITMTAAAVALAVLLTGCVTIPGTIISLLPLQSGSPADPVAPPEDDDEPAEPASGPLAVGSCLDGMNGYDSDREALVGCGGPHLYEVVAITEWPGMADAIAEDGAEEVFEDIRGDEDRQDYWDWGALACAAAVRDTLGIDDVVVDGIPAADLWLRLGGGYGVDISLASREAFVAGDHTTVCSAAWYHSAQRPTRVTYPDGLGFADLQSPEFGQDWRECYTADYHTASCDQPHWAQTIVGFDGLHVFDEAFITRVAESSSTSADWALADAFCEKLLAEVLPPGSNADEFAHIADTDFGYGWDEWEGEVDPLGGYSFMCEVTAPRATDQIVGDVLSGSATIAGGSAI